MREGPGHHLRWPPRCRLRAPWARIRRALHATVNSLDMAGQSFILGFACGGDSSKRSGLQDDAQQTAGDQRSPLVLMIDLQRRLEIDRTFGRDRSAGLRKIKKSCPFDYGQVLAHHGFQRRPVLQRVVPS